jgi:hypothetical protein
MTHMAIVEGDETGATPGASRLTHSQLSQKYDTGGPSPCIDLRHILIDRNDPSASKASPSKQNKINLAKFMFDQDKGYKKPEFFPPEPLSLISSSK